MMSQIFYELREFSGRNRKVGLDISNYKKNADLKEVLGIESRTLS